VLQSGLVGPMPGWPFVDWRPGLDGWAYRGKGMLSCVITMQYIGALREAAALERAFADPARGEGYLKLAERSKDAINRECWDEQRKLYADTPAKQQFSQHGAALAVLYDIAPRELQQGILERVMIPGRGIEAPNDITTTSYYFSFYLARALQHAGLADRYFDFLKPWREMLRRHFTTWPETPDPSRSDSHAWSGHPTGGLLEYVAGITP
jgi:alpha-L-rhamnosidase